MKILQIFVILSFITVLLNPSLADAEESKFNPFGLKIAAAIKEGFESNVFLDSSRKGDWFTETDIYAEGEYKITDKLAVGVEYDFINLSYNEFTDLNLVNNEGRAFFKYYLKDGFSIKTGYVLDSVWYPHDKDGTYFTQGPLAEIEYYINKDLFLTGAYEFKEYDYDKRKIKDGTGKTLSTNREDCMHSMTFGVGDFVNIGRYIKDLLVKVEEKIDFNDSNDEYMDYYDYISYKTSAFISMPVFKVLYLVGHGSYRYKDFDTRKNIDLNATETQKTFVLGATVYYNIYKSAYISAGYTYTQTYSNEPTNRYSDSISSAGIHIFF
ncbi:MAG: hypothetical protein JSW18_03815 [Candidatus Omnitrophota bacterium]|nr:MAG: hypothetical protein JSW18_03815 [Candidatus Omnitrophota bacterium]